MDTSEYRDVFAAEARDYLQSLNNDLLALENDPGNLSILDDMFRAAHSLKGMAGTMGYQELANYTHKMESVFDLLRTGSLKATREISNVLFRTVDMLEVLLEQTLTGQPMADTTQTAIELDMIVSGQLSTPASEVIEAKPVSQAKEGIDNLHNLVLDEFDRDAIRQGQIQSYRAYEIVIRLRPKTLLKSVRVYTVFQALEGYGTIIKSVPAAQDLEDERFDLEFTVLYLTQENEEKIKSIIEGISEIDEVIITPATMNINEASTLVSKSEVAAASEPLQLVPEPLEQKQTTAVPPTTIHNRGIYADKFVRVETERLDKLINLVGELVISRTQVLELAKSDSSDSTKNAAVQLDRITTEIQYASMKLRMVPIRQVFDRFPRMVRDLAQARGKNIQFEVFGEETELDRTLVNNISDPLVHLIRNSIDHGIESENVRVKIGKAVPAQLRLEARHEGSHVVIEVSDDGQGIDVAKIKQTAIKRGLLPANHQGDLSIDEAIDLLFKPGFSTSDKVTDISGRGVGMDAVKSTVESLSGQVVMKSVPGQGTVTTIKLPLTLAIIKALLVVCQNQTYAIPIQAVRENLLVSQDQIQTLSQRDVIVLRNEVLPLLDLAETLGFERSKHGETLSVIVTESQGEKVGFIVDDLIGQQEIVIKSLASILGDINGIGGATVLGNGEVALILDQSTLIRGRSE